MQLMSEEKAEGLDLERANEFVEKASALYTVEHGRVNALQPIVIHAIHENLLHTSELQTQHRRIRPDGTVSSRARANGFQPPVVITEVKNEIGIGECDPLAQAACGYVLLVSKPEVCCLLHCIHLF